MSNSLSIAKVAEQLGVHSDTVRRAIKKGKLKAHRVETQIRILPDSLDKYIEENTVRVVPKNRNKITPETTIHTINQ